MLANMSSAFKMFLLQSLETSIVKSLRCFSSTVPLSQETVREKFPRRPKKMHWSSIKPCLACPICGSKFRDESVLNMHIGFEHSRVISEKLRNHPIQTYKSIFGEENVKSISSNELRFQNGLVVTLRGDFKGCWFSFVDNVGGEPLRALRVTQNLSVADAAIYGLNLVKSLGHSITDGDDIDSIKRRLKSGIIDTSPLASPSSSSKLRDLRRQVALNIWDASVELKGSLAEKYLVQHRKVPFRILDQLDFRFLPKGAKFLDLEEENFVEVQSSNPALLVRAENSKGELTGVQRIFLSSDTGSKPKWMPKNKFSRGVLQGSAAIVRRGEPGQDVFVAEGPETAASVVAVHLQTSSKSPVLASLSLSNVLNMSEFLISLRPKRVIMAADNDGHDSELTKKSRLIFEELRRQLSAHSVPLVVVFPPGQDKRDWNDLLRSDGLSRTRKIFRDELEKSDL